MSQHPSILIALAADRRRILESLSRDIAADPRPSMLARLKATLRRRPATRASTRPALSAARDAPCQ